MKAFVLCAGRGTRLMPLTSVMPKPLLPVFGRPLILHIFEHLKSAGIRDIVINLHYLGHKIKRFLGNGRRFGVQITYSAEKDLMDTGGAVKKAERFLMHGAFILYNCDIVTNVDIKRMLLFHRKNKNLITLLASRRHNPKHLITSEGEGYAFCGIHIIEPFIFRAIPENTPVSIIKVYSRLIEEGVPIDIFPLENAFWRETGRRDSYEAVNRKRIGQKILQGGSRSYIYRVQDRKGRR